MKLIGKGMYCLFKVSYHRDVQKSWSNIANIHKGVKYVCSCFHPLQTNKKWLEIWNVLCVVCLQNTFAKQP